MQQVGFRLTGRERRRVFASCRVLRCPSVSSASSRARTAFCSSTWRSVDCRNLTSSQQSAGITFSAAFARFDLSAFGCFGLSASNWPRSTWVARRSLSTIGATKRPSLRSPVEVLIWQGSALVAIKVRCRAELLTSLSAYIDDASARRRRSCKI